MLVLTRKTDEQILIGNDIKITLVRVRGNSVRIGIDAPREVRVMRAELDAFDSKGVEPDYSLSDREQPFAHPQPRVVACQSQQPKNQFAKPADGKSDPVLQTTTPQPFESRVQRSSDEVKLARAPLAGFVSAS